MNIKELKKIRPLFTKIVTTMNRYEEDQTTEGGLVVAQKQAGAVKEYQTIVAVGSKDRKSTRLNSSH